MRATLEASPITSLMKESLFISSTALHREGADRRNRQFETGKLKAGLRVKGTEIGWQSEDHCLNLILNFIGKLGVSQMRPLPGRRYELRNASHRRLYR